MKIIFDRSAFHGERFDLLERSRLPVLVGTGKILVYHTTNVIDETFQMAKSNKPGAKDELRRQWPFLKSICNGGWFRPLLVGQPPKLQSVCDEELEGGEKDSCWPLLSAEQRRIGEATLTKRLEESGPFPELEHARPIYDQNAQLKKENMELRTQLRREHIPWQRRDVP